ncbi:MAG: ABC transporter [Candidatus Fraserbacteria bacterium RBG_16_55_9]|uniref:ABC transporter n=1 Tax=Fraserbacteria sp. (strain RBG_16_55_9) TaxID=1817864 RepID=A0A1F5UTX4_FRAXR|nr:MAG: ABC transporter [Candidatus Fraserbacteria bacterium RBG_16_55_9]
MRQETGAPVVLIHDVTKEYQLGKTTILALKGVSLGVSRGEFLCVAGPSGSGKTTLLNMIGCLDKPTSGQVAIEGREVTSLSRDELARLRRQKIGFIFQTFSLIPVLSAYENVEFPLVLRGDHAKHHRERVGQILQAVGLDEVVRHRPDELSGGQQQRVAIARALVTEPALILADEPTANLDSETGKSIIDLMHRLSRDQGTTFVFSTHDLKIMERADRIVHLKDGSIVPKS